MAVEARRLGLRILHLPFLGEWDPLSAALLRRAAGRRSDQVVLHAHTGHTAALACLASRAGGPPTVVHRRVDFPLSGRISRSLKYQTAGRVLAVSAAIGELLVRQGIAPASVEVISDCVPVGAREAAVAGQDAPLEPPSQAERLALRRELSKRWSLDEAAPWIANLAALVGHKDHATLVRAAAAMKVRLPGARWVVAGEGPLRRELETLARAAGVEREVRFVGWQADAATVLGAFDLYVQSSWGEGLGSVLLEAMARGLPIVATAAGGIPEVVEDGRTGLLVPPRDPAALAASVSTALGDGALRARLAAAARKGLSRFGLEACCRRVEDVYTSLWTARRSPEEERT